MTGDKRFALSPTGIRFRRLLLVVGLILLGLAGIFCVLRFGNSQWNRWIYVFQSRFVAHGDLLGPPHGFTGVWHGWESDGSLSFEVDCVNGKCNGPFLAKWPSGKIYMLINRKDDNWTGPVLVWDGNGNLIAEGHYVDNAPYDGSFYSESFGVLQEYRNGDCWNGFFMDHGAAAVYKDGKLIRRESCFCRWAGDAWAQAREETRRILAKRLSSGRR